MSCIMSSHVMYTVMYNVMLYHVICHRTYRTPFVLGVVTDNDEKLTATSTATTGTDTMNRGFRLFYRQNPCS